jgi:hypothetical protein
MRQVGYLERFGYLEKLHGDALHGQQNINFAKLSICPPFSRQGTALFALGRFT